METTMDKWELQRQADNAKRATVKNDLRTVAQFLGPEWIFDATDDSDRCQITSSKLALHFSIDMRADRVTISDLAWPTYINREKPYNDSGKTVYGTKERVMPRDLAPRQSIDSIGVALSRGPEAIAKEIKRRLLPEYMRVYALCEELAVSRQQYQDKTANSWESICSLVGEDGNNRRTGGIYAKTRFGSIFMENRNGKAYFNLTVTAEQMPAILAALGHEKKEEQTNG